MKHIIFSLLAVMTVGAKAQTVEGFSQQLLCTVTEIEGGGAASFASYLPPQVGDKIILSAAGYESSNLTFDHSHQIPLLHSLKKRAATEPTKHMAIYEDKDLSGLGLDSLTVVMGEFKDAVNYINFAATIQYVATEEATGLVSVDTARLECELLPWVNSTAK